MPRIRFHTKLFVIYALIVVCLISATFGGFYWRDRQIAYETLLGSLSQEAERVASQLDGMLMAADLMASQIRLNSDIAHTFYLLAFDEEPVTYFRRQPATEGRLQATIDSIVGLDPLSFYRISIISRTGAFVSIGAYADRSRVRTGASSLSWQGVRSDEGMPPQNRWILPPHADPWGEDGQEVVSVMRRIETNGYAHAIVEIQIPYEQFTAMTNRMKTAPETDKDRGKQTWVFERSGIPVVGPPASSRERQWAGSFHEAVQLREGRTFTLEVDAPETYVLAASRSQHSDWSVVVSQRWSDLTAPIRRTGYLFGATGLALLAVSLVTIFFSTRAATLPLVKLSRIMQKLPYRRDDTDGMFEEVDIQRTHNEVVHLYHSFRKLLDRLEQTAEREVQAQTRELEARYAALQAQIHPHFLYNTLSMIGMMGRDTGNARILRVCTMLVDMLRYTTYAGDRTVRIREELSYTLNYLNIMTSRYGEHLAYTVSIPDELLEERLPKLTLQPFVENAIKHGFARKKYPWHIDIAGTVNSMGWTITIGDNGSGFPDALLARWETASPQAANEQLRAIAGPEAGEGSGMLNTYLRLHMEYGERLVFRLENRPGGGAQITLGIRKALPEPEEGGDICSA